MISNATTENRLNNGRRRILFNQFEEEQHQLNEDDASDSFSQMMEDMHINAAARKEQALTEANASTPRTTKLSTLQRQILLIALRWRGKAHSDVYNSDIKVEVFGWQAMSHYSNGWVVESRFQQGTARRSIDHPYMANSPDGGQIFDRKSIGERRYNTVSVSVSRALKRLTERHLLYQSGAGWSLTKHGAEVANTPTTSTHV